MPDPIIYPDGNTEAILRKRLLEYLWAFFFLDIHILQQSMDTVSFLNMYTVLARVSVQYTE